MNMSYDNNGVLSPDLTAAWSDPLSIPRQDLSTGTPVTPRQQDQWLHPSFTTPAVSQATATASTPAPVAQTQSEPQAKNASVHSRRRGLALGVLAALGIALYSGEVNLPTQMPSLGSVQAVGPAAPDEQTSARANAKLSSMLAQAKAIRATTGTFRGIDFPADVQTMQSDNMLVLSTVVDGSCWFAAVLPGFDPIPRWDPTATRCNIDRLKVQQADVDAGR
jgi:hypothetical protein